MRIIGGIFRGRVLESPKTNATRPTTSSLREAVFNIAAPWIEGARFLDLFAGSGSMGCEAISRGASFVTFVEKEAKALECIRNNISSLGIEQQTQVLGLDVRKALMRLMSPYDVIYIDPPYEQEASETLSLIIEKGLLTPNGRLFLETRFKTSLPTLPRLERIDSRKFGDSHLHQFRCPINCG